MFTLKARFIFGLFLSFSLSYCTSDGQEDQILVTSPTQINNETITNNESTSGESQTPDNSSESNSSSTDSQTTETSSDGNSQSQDSDSNVVVVNSNNSVDISLEGDLVRGATFEENIYLTSKNKIYVSNDFGETWKVLITVEESINDIKILDQNIFYFSTDSSKIYKSINAGFTFEFVQFTEYWSRNNSINGLEIVGDYLYAIRTRENYFDLINSLDENNSSGYFMPGAYSFGFTTELLKLDMDLNLIENRSSATKSSFNISSHENSILIPDRSTIDAFDVESLERLSSYSYRTDQEEEFVLTIIPTNNYILAVGGGVWVSTNSGQSFTKKTFPDLEMIFSATFDSQGNVYICGKNGFLAYSDPNLTEWSVIETNTQEDIYFVGVIGNKLIVSGSNAYFKVFNLQ